MKNKFDKARIDFLVNRDGTEKTIEFSQRTLKQYRNLLKERNMQRRNLVLCCLTHREYLIQNRSYYGSTK